MKRKLNLIPLALLCGMLFTGFTHPVAPKKAVNDVTVTVYLPYTGMYNEWVITFYDRNSSDYYEFYTDDDTFNSQILGSLPPGNYNVDIQSGYFPHPFDFWMSSPNYSSHRAVMDGFMWYNVVVEEGSVLQIDEG